METTASTGPVPCVSCGRPSATPYCPHCGERRASDRHYSIAHFAEETVEAFTHVDGKLLHTFATLLRRPGELTRAYMAGIRVPYLKPLAVFLIVNVVYFLWVSTTGDRVFDTPLAYHLANQHYGPHAGELVARRIAERGVPREVYAAAFDRAATVQAKSLVIAMVPMIALLLAGLQVRRRAPFVQHLVFALHLEAVFLLLTIAQHYVLGWPLGFAVRAGWLPATSVDGVVTAVLLVAIGSYAAFGLRRAYGDGRFGATSKAVVLSIGVVASLLLYRVLLFYTTYWAT